MDNNIKSRVSKLEKVIGPEPVSDLIEVVRDSDGRLLDINFPGIPDLPGEDGGQKLNRCAHLVPRRILKEFFEEITRDGCCRFIPKEERERGIANETVTTNPTRAGSSKWSTPTE